MMENTVRVDIAQTSEESFMWTVYSGKKMLAWANEKSYQLCVDNSQYYIQLYNLNK